MPAPTVLDNGKIKINPVSSKQSSAVKQAKTITNDASKLANQVASRTPTVTTSQSNTFSSTNNTGQIANELSMSAASQANQYNREMMESQQNFNAAQAEINRKWQEEMSNTAYQRAVADMKQAGINPILAYTQGGASTPTGSTATSGMASANMPSFHTDMDSYTNQATYDATLQLIQGISGAMGNLFADVTSGNLIDKIFDYNNNSAKSTANSKVYGNELFNVSVKKGSIADKASNVVKKWWNYLTSERGSK